MVLKRLRKKAKKLKASREKRQAKRKGMTVTEYREHKKRLARKKKAEQAKHEEWLIEEQFRWKRATVQRTGQSSRVLGILATMARNAAQNIYGLQPPKKKKKRKKRARRRR